MLKRFHQFVAPCLLKRKGGGREAFSALEAETRDLPQLLEVVIHGISENVKGTAPLSLEKTLGHVWQALSARTQADGRAKLFT